MKKRAFVTCDADPDFVVYDFSDPGKTEIAEGTHALFAFVKLDSFAASIVPDRSRNLVLCTYRPGDQPPPPDLVTTESLLPVSVRCANDEQLAEKRNRFPQLALVEAPPAALPISSRYRLVERSADSTTVDGASFGGTLRWRGDPLSIKATFAFVISMNVMNNNIGNRKQMMDVASFYGFIEAPVEALGSCGFCLSRS